MESHCIGTCQNRGSRRILTEDFPTLAATPPDMLYRKLGYIREDHFQYFHRLLQ